MQLHLRKRWAEHGGRYGDLRREREDGRQQDMPRLPQWLLLLLVFWCGKFGGRQRAGCCHSPRGLIQGLVRLWPPNTQPFGPAWPKFFLFHRSTFALRCGYSSRRDITTAESHFLGCWPPLLLRIRTPATPIPETSITAFDCQPAASLQSRKLYCCFRRSPLEIAAPVPSAALQSSPQRRTQLLQSHLATKLSLVSEATIKA